MKKLNKLENQKLSVESSGKWGEKENHHHRNCRDRGIIESPLAIAGAQEKSPWKPALDHDWLTARGSLRTGVRVTNSRRASHSGQCVRVLGAVVILSWILTPGTRPGCHSHYLKKRKSLLAKNGDKKAFLNKSEHSILSRAFPKRCYFTRELTGGALSDLQLSWARKSKLESSLPHGAGVVGEMPNARRL